MTDFNESHELDELGRRLRDERAEATDLELDRAKLRAMSRASRPSRRRGFMKARTASVVVALALIGGGAGAIAKNGGSPPSPSSTNSSANSQYCPQSSQSGGKAKDPGPPKCGHPKNK